MKILYIASNPSDAGSLNLDKEITELQRRVLDSSVEPASIVFMPELQFGDLPKVLHGEKPDILHLAAHGDGENLKLANEAGQRVSVSADMLRTFMSDRHPPRLVYINACDSNAISQGLLGTVPMAIGSTAPISNRVARMAAIAFYERILDGSSVGRAFEVCQKMMEGAADNHASARLHTRTGIDPTKEILYAVPRLIPVRLAQVH
jgi:CHAT domain-containing protein